MSMILDVGNEFQAPMYSDNAIGTPKWAGLHADDFTDELLQSLRLFIVREAERRGNNDFIYDRVDHKGGNLFHPKFLQGWAFDLWAQNYSVGIDKSK